MLGLDCGLSPTKQFSEAYGTEYVTQGLRHVRYNWRRKIKRETLPLVILNSLISIISNSDIRAMSAHFYLELIPKP
jgi:hypothetical protein